MKLADARAAYDSFSGKLSEINRQLALGGIAIIWVLRVGKEESGGLTYDPKLLWPLAFFAGSLAADVLQYLYATIAWAIYSRRKELKGTGKDDEFKAPRSLNWATNVFFYAKIGFLLTAFFFLLRFIVPQLFK